MYCMFSFQQDKEKFLRQLEDTENWLYEEGEDCKKHVYVDKLAELKVSQITQFVLVPCKIVFLTLTCFIFKGVSRGRNLLSSQPASQAGW